MSFQLPDRLKALPPYLFVAIDRKKRALLEAGKDVISFGVGDPDQPTPSHIVQQLQKSAENPAWHRYPHDLGLPAFRQDVARFFERRYRVKLDPDTEILTLIGTKEGLGHLSLATLNPGAMALIPEPGYPVYRSSVLFAGGLPFTLELREENDFLPDLAAVPHDVARNAGLLFINYPNNPTGAVAPLRFFEQAVRFAQEHDLIVVSDAAYNEMYFSEPAHSVFEVPGARDVAVELHSLSKTFNMTGWRVGFAAGNAQVLAALAKLKSNLDSSQFSAIQEAGAAALRGYFEQPDVPHLRKMYQERATIMAEGLRRLGFRVREPRATFYLWCGVPTGQTSLGVAEKLLDEAAVVCVPGSGFGKAGEGYVRFALTVSAERTREALDRMNKVRW